MTIYYSLSADSDFVVPKNEIFYQSENFEQASEQASQISGLVVIGWEKGSFVDCWLKLQKKPEPEGIAFGNCINLYQDGYASVDDVKCYVSPPGEHPGGREWWLTPVEPIYCPVYAENDCE